MVTPEFSPGLWRGSENPEGAVEELGLTGLQGPGRRSGSRVLSEAAPEAVPCPGAARKTTQIPGIRLCDQKAAICARAGCPEAPGWEGESDLVPNPGGE